MSIEPEHLAAALAEAEQVVEDSERAQATSAAAAWWSSCRTLRRFLCRPDAFSAP